MGDLGVRIFLFWKRYFFYISFLHFYLCMKLIIGVN